MFEYVTNGMNTKWSELIELTPINCLSDEVVSINFRAYLYLSVYYSPTENCYKI